MKRILPMVAATAVTSSLLSTEAQASKASIIEELKYEPIDMTAKVIRSIAEGLSLYKHVDKLTVCDYHS